MFKKSLGIHISEDCNLRCPGCYLEKRVERGNLELLGNLLRSFSKDREVWVAINSGHISPGRDLDDLNLKLHGLTTTPDVLLAEPGLAEKFEQINLSFDAFKMKHFSEEMYSRAIRRIEAAGRKVGLSVICYVTDDPELVADRIANLTTSSAPEVYLLVLKGVSPTEAAASTRSLIDLNSRLYSRGVINTKWDNCLTLLSNCQVCEAGTSTIDVEVNGNVSSCSFLKNIGNIFRENAEEVLARAAVPAGPCNSMTQFVRQQTESRK